MPIAPVSVLACPMISRWNLPVILCGVLAMTAILPPSMAVLPDTESKARAHVSAAPSCPPRPSDGLVHHAVPLLQVS